MLKCVPVIRLTLVSRPGHCIFVSDGAFNLAVVFTEYIFSIYLLEMMAKMRTLSHYAHYFFSGKSFVYSYTKQSIRHHLL